ncbi:MAG: 30S ribosomal protein S12 methylthiotransferase RimO [bacterium]|nr:30S ribosomal protein S12 methylthiotransferase RimO [bacterium]
MKFFVHKLGCPKNDVDADYISARLIAEGHQPVADPNEADSVIVNTCGFIQSAKEESIDEILRLGQLKKEGNLKTLYASGCLTQRYGDEMLKEMPELDGTFGHGALDSIARAVSESSHATKTVRMETRKLGYLSFKQRFIADAYPHAYLKISDGCDRPCTYCAIPGMRGRFRSRPKDSIVNEARYLAENGKKELILVSQEATLWGYDLPDRPTIKGLLEALDAIEEVRWIRLMYLYPAQVNDELIRHLAATNKTLDYFDLPLQHVNTDILRAMKRQFDRSQTDGLMSRIRELSPEAVLRTTMIVGFPGETEEQFEELMDFVIEQRFDRLGVFAYSPEEGTPAEQMPDQIPEKVKTERVDRIMSLQREIAFEKNNSLIGNVKEVIIDSVKAGESAVGRTKGDCPEIDQEVMVSGEASEVGDICRVRIEGVEGYDLVGTRLPE